MRKSLLCIAVFLFTLSLSAQEKGKIRVGLAAGLAFPSAGLGFNGDVDMRYNIMDNLNVGIKFGLAALGKDLSMSYYAGTSSATASALTYSLLSSDYYFNKPESNFAPFLGAGFGSYSICNIQIVSSSNQSTPSNLLIERKLGGLLRGGFEAGHFRMGLEYYLIPRSSLVDVNNNLIGTTRNSYINLSIGFYFGGGHWRKK